MPGKLLPGIFFWTKAKSIFFTIFMKNKTLTMNKITFLFRITICFSLLTTSFIFSQYDATNAQVGDELTVNGMLSTQDIDPEEGVNGNGSAGVPYGWNYMQGTNYAPTNTGNNNGVCHSENRQFKMYATNGNSGSFVNQEISNLPTGTFTYDYWTKWAGVPVYVNAEGELLEPKFTIRVFDNVAEAWVAVHEEVIPLSENQIWAQTTGSWVNDEVRDVRIQWYKRGGNGANPTGMNKSMFIDSVTFTYTSTSLSLEDTSLTDLKVFPNPSSVDFLTISTAEQGDKYVKVFNVTGQMAMNTKLVQNQKLNISSLSSGFYLIEVNINGRSDTLKLVIE